MASLGSVVSTAITGEAAPVFVGVQKEVAKQLASLPDSTTELRGEVARLEALLNKVLAAQEAAPTVETVQEVPEDKPVVKTTTKATK